MFNLFNTYNLKFNMSNNHKFNMSNNLKYHMLQDNSDFLEFILKLLDNQDNYYPLESNNNKFKNNEQ